MKIHTTAWRTGSLFLQIHKSGIHRFLVTRLVKLSASSSFALSHSPALQANCIHHQIRVSTITPADLAYYNMNSRATLLFFRLFDDAPQALLRRRPFAE